MELQTTQRWREVELGWWYTILEMEKTPLFDVTDLSDKNCSQKKKCSINQHGLK